MTVLTTLGSVPIASDRERISQQKGSWRKRQDLTPWPCRGRLHGGVIAAVLDAMGGLAGMVAIGEHHAHETAEQVMHRFVRYGTIDMRVDFLRPGMGRPSPPAPRSHVWAAAWPARRCGCTTNRAP